MGQAFVCANKGPTGKYATADALRTYLRTRRNPPPDWDHALLVYPSDEEIRAELGGRDLVCWCGPDDPCHGLVLLEAANPRTWTPKEQLPDGGRRITMKRHCNGFGRRLGDVTTWEVLLATHWSVPLPDVRDECPTCTPARAESTRWTPGTERSTRPAAPA
ncbi:DUF4326 domain-containing protein [Actinacidiphila glaucinigra]|uniref:DUF4326 domain-containing protein n=1 Tax=Actinacidiphila glaucinigra TaxID=235986 RepID=UPI003721FE6D